MTATTTPASNDDIVLDAPPTPPRLLVPGLIAGAIAAGATSAIVLVAHAAGDAVAVGGKQIPVGGFAQFVLVGALIGIALARMFSRRAQRPRSTFVRTTMVLTALSFVPDLLVEAPSGSKLALVLTHVIAAAIIIPSLAARLPRHA
jgi:Family of unknown function (DUF6069)